VYAIIADGAHQYRLEEGTVFQVQVKPGLNEDSKTLSFDRIMIIGDIDGGPIIGNPTISGAKVDATILREFKGEKITIQKFKRRKKYARKQGHRQRYLEVRVDKISH
jgi:large subunit ribosomal protein L21